MLPSPVETGRAPIDDTDVGKIVDYLAATY
jgi:hypothetical protein